MPEAQAEILAETQTALIDEKLANKNDLLQLSTKDDLAKIDVRFVRVEGDIKLLKGMLGVVIAGIGSLFAGVALLVIKAFTH